MAALSDYLKTKILNLVFNNVPFVPPATIAVALCNAAPQASDTGATIPEIIGGAYIRKNVANWTLSTNSADNTVSIIWPVATTNWGAITHIALLDDATPGAGNLLFYGALNASVSVNIAQIFSFNTGELNVQIE